MAASVPSPEGGEPHRGGEQGHSTRLDLIGDERVRRIALERKRVFLHPEPARQKFFHALAFFGAVMVSAVVLALSSATVWAALVWLALMASAELATTTLNHHLHRHPARDGDLPFWAAVKTGTSGLEGVAWSLGPYLLHVPGEPISVLAPAWGVLMATAGTVFACAAYPPAMYVMMATTIAPAVAYLAAKGAPMEFAVAVCLAASLPFAFAIGSLAIRNVGDLIASRLDVAASLARAEDLSARLKASYDERTRFFSAASHDLRQPLQALSFYVTLIATGADPTSRREHINRLAECADHLERQFNAILGVATSDAAVQRAEPRAIALAPILERARAAAAPEAQAKRLALKARTPELAVSAPPEILERVLINLSVNAARYTETGGVLIGARRRGAMVEIVVADTGVGIGADDLPHVFDDFYQAANPERAREKGFGLGLAIVKRLCEGMEWPFGVRSAPGRGSLFWVRVPRAAAPEKPAAPDGAGAAVHDLSALRVLIVDDDALVRDATQRLLAAWGVRHHGVVDGAEALAVLNGAPAETWCALVDYRLAAGETGLDVARALQGAAKGKLSVVFVTGEANDALVAEAAGIGAVVLRKPLKPIKLRAVLMAAADAARREEAVAARG